MRFLRGGLQAVVKGQRFRALAGGGTTLRVVSAAAIAFSMVSGVNSAAAQSTMPCRYEVAHVIQGPICPITQAPAVTIGTAISPSGRYVCGYYRLCGPSQNRAFFYDTQTHQFTTLPYAESPFTSANDVNDEHVVGQANGLGFLYHIATGQTTLLYPPVPPEVGTCSVNAINSSNAVCGTRTIQVSPTRSSAFRWSAQSGFEDLGLINGLSTSGADLNDAADYCGWFGNSASSSNARGIVWSSGAVTELPPIPGGLSSACLAMNNLGTSCGHGLYPGPTGNVVHAFIWTNGAITDLGVLDGFLRSFALDISDKNEIVGYCRTLVNGSDVIRPYVWQNGSMRDLDALVPSLQIPLKIAWGIDTEGRIVAQADSITYVVTPVYGNAGDANLDCETNHLDLLHVIANWGMADSSADLNSDGIVNVLDLLIVISNWTFE